MYLNIGMFKKWKFFLRVFFDITGIEYNFLKINFKNHIKNFKKYLYINEKIFYFVFIEITTKTL